jgi:hypothetical protein
MTSSTSSRVVRALLANVALASAACGVFGSDSPAGADQPPAQTPATDADGGVVDGPKAPPITGPAAQNELTDELGIFVASNGLDNADGTHAHPLAKIQAGIDKAKTVGKRVYVCAGTYKESLVIADSISVIGGLDCTNNEWRTGTGVSRIESPTSPAMRAKDIKSATRLEGLDVNAPNATAPSGSSIGLLADHATALVVARTKITAGNATKGDDGTEGTALSNAASAKGENVVVSYQCVVSTPGRVSTHQCGYTTISGDFKNPPGGAPGTNTCVGAAGFLPTAGGVGGSGGIWDAKTDSMALSTTWNPHSGNEAFRAQVAPGGPTAAAGTDGPDGTSATASGAISAEGYTPADGTAGGNGSTGFGGKGGDGSAPTQVLANDSQTWRGWGGAGGGAGGCPGLAGTAGKGGGASIAAALLESPVTFDTTELVSGAGGAGGVGTLGSPPTAGGASGDGIPGRGTQGMGTAGGRGGAAGVSGNGGNGPSAAIAHVGPAPVLVGANKTTPGTAAPAIAARSRTDLGITKTVPATPPGASKAILPL